MTKFIQFRESSPALRQIFNMQGYKHQHHQKGLNEIRKPVAQGVCPKPFQYQSQTTKTAIGEVYD